MKILFCPEYFVPSIGGGEIWSYYVSKGLSDKGHIVYVLTYKHKNALKNEKYGNLNIIRGGKNPINTFDSYFKRAINIGLLIYKLGHKLNYDIIIANNTFPLIVAWLVSKFKKKPIIAVFHNFYGLKFSLEEKGIIKGIIRGLTEYIAHKLDYDLVLVLSTSVKEKLIKRGINAKKIFVVPGGVNINYIDSVKEEKSSDNLIIFIGRLVRMKRVDILLKAFKIVNSRIPNSKLIIVGDGPLKFCLMELARFLNIENSVDFLGFVSEEEKIRLLKKATVLVLPSVLEGFGLVILESLASGTPVITSDMEGPKDIITNGVDGFLTKPLDVKEVAEKIQYILEHRDIAMGMGLRGKQKVHEKYSWDKTVDKINNIIEALVMLRQR